MTKAQGSSKGLQRAMKRQQRRLSGKMLGIGDGANDVAMIQAADVGIGIMGKEGRQVRLLSICAPLTLLAHVQIRLHSCTACIFCLLVLLVDAIWVGKHHR